MMVDLVAEGDQRHAGYAAADGEFVNAALVLARDLLKLDGALRRAAPTPCSAAPPRRPTMLEAGVSRNVTPPVAKAVLDVRSTPDWTHDEIADAAARARSTPRWSSPRSRLVPCETPADSRLLAAAARVRPEASAFGSPTCSDWVFLRHADAIKCGPGTSRRSHTPDEYVDLPEVTAARGVLRALARDYLAGADEPHGAEADTLWATRAPGSTRRMLDLHRGRRPAVGCAAPRAGTCSAAWATSRACGPRGLLTVARARPAPPRACARALAAVERGRLARRRRRRRTCTPPSRTGSPAGCPALGERLHTGRSRNDQVACDLRLYLKDRLLALHAARARPARTRCSPSPRGTGACSGRDTPTSGGRCRRRSGSGPARTPRGCSTPSSRWPRLWASVDRSPLGSAAGYGVPLPLRREVAARALGFAGLDRNVATVQGGRGKLEAAALFWCTQLGHELARLSQDVILFSAEEFGYLTLPAELATGSSIMPHKRNPDLFELTRGRAAALEGDLAAVLQIKAKLSSGYHRDFQLLKEPLMRGLDRTEAMLAMHGRRGAAARRGPGALRRGARRRRARDRRGDAAGRGGRGRSGWPTARWRRRSGGASGSPRRPPRSSSPAAARPAASAISAWPRRAARAAAGPAVEPAASGAKFDGRDGRLRRDARWPR